MSLVKFDVTRNSPKWTLNSSGNLQSGSNNLPGFEFNPDLTYKGMLVETAATNLITYSEDFTNADWSVNAGSITANQAVAPDGSTTADEFYNENQQLRQSVSGLSLNTVYTFSIFCKANTATNVELEIQGTGVTGTGGSGPGTSNLFIFNLSNGTISESGNYTASIKNVGNGWYRCGITFITDGDGGECLPALKPTGWSSGESIYIWGAQVEEGDKASSYIKTTNQTETRNEDVITLTSASQYLPSEGKVTFGWEQKEDDTIYIGALSASVASGSRELVYEYSSTEQTLFIDGTEVQTVTGQFDFSNMNEIQLGHINGVDQPNTHLKYFAVE